MVELASLSDGLQIAQEVARTLSIPERLGEPPESTIVAGVAQSAFFYCSTIASISSSRALPLPSCCFVPAHNSI